MSYEIIRPLGRGGMGDVHLARDTRLNRQVAIKTLRPDLGRTEYEARLRREAQLLAQLNHPNIVQLFDLIEYRGQPALVMEYVDGHSLHIALREGRGDRAVRLRWLSEVAAGLARAHEAGIAHRDLKPENVLISSDGTAKVTDFGIAESGDRRDMAGDMAALGDLGVELLGEAADQSPALRHLLERLPRKWPGGRPDAAEAAEGFRLAWHESTQNETEPGRADTREGLYKVLWPALAGALVLAGTLTWWLLGRAAEPTYVAVLAPTLAGPAKLPESEQMALATTVQKALEQAVLEAGELALVSAAETAALSGTPRELVIALGADEVLASRLRCGETACELALERVGREGSVLTRADTTLTREAIMQSWALVLGQWPRLYPGIPIDTALNPMIDETDFRQYLSLQAESSTGNHISEQALFEQVEALLARADRFLPLYTLYTDVALNLYADTNNPAYLQRTEQLLESASHWAGDSLLLRYGQLQLALEKREFSAAARLLAIMGQLGADRALMHTLEARLHFYQGEFEAADRNYRAALKLRPARHLYYNSAWVNYEWGKPERALELLRQSLAIYPGDRAAHGMVGMILLHAGDFDGAVSHFETAESFGGSQANRSNLGLAFLMRGDYDQAREQFRALYESGARDPVMIINLADSEALLGNSETAARYYREVIEGQLSGQGIRDPRALSQAYAQLGMHEQAIATLKVAAGSQERNSEDNFNAALVYTLAGQDIVALVEVEQALASGFSPIWFGLPFFDSLCQRQAFDRLLAEAGMSGRCQRIGEAPETLPG